MTERFDGEGVALAVDVAGPEDGTPVLLFHGGGQTRHSWHHTAAALADHGWRTYNTDLRGHGESDWDARGDYSLDAFAADIRAIARTVTSRNPRATKPALVGASLGGVASL